MISRSVWCSISHATATTDMGKVRGVTVQRETVAAFQMQSAVKRFVLQVPTAQRSRGLPRRCGWSVMAL